MLIKMALRFQDYDFEVDSYIESEVTVASNKRGGPVNKIIIHFDTAGFDTELEHKVFDDHKVTEEVTAGGRILRIDTKLSDTNDGLIPGRAVQMYLNLAMNGETELARAISFLGREIYLSRVGKTEALSGALGGPD